ncbi:Hypothetical protein MPUT9231_5100 [Mycoplasma putrefaciens Mput9231]|uniref:Uncharacterized protein n=1 Tax=Mycoplasma putrefaciens Mput9231 TaxID=1292033 RepID=M9WCQ9_9MOLU|nr:Hypothetical protein MPUT9231_5100 [Mycoplasma putrefaciens Mput9231]
MGFLFLALTTNLILLFFLLELIYYQSFSFLPIVKSVFQWPNSSLRSIDLSLVYMKKTYSELINLSITVTFLLPPFL